MIKAVLFDFDGVLTLDATGSTSIINYIVHETGIEKKLFVREYSKYNRDLLYGNKTHKQIWNSLCDNLNKDISIEVLYDSFINTPMDNNMLGLVGQIKDLGYMTGIITDNKKDRIDMISKYFELEKLFDYIVVSAEIGSGKDDEVIFQRTIQDFSIEPNQCIFIDNSKKNLVIPRRMGMKTLFYNHEVRDFEQLKLELESLGIAT